MRDPLRLRSILLFSIALSGIAQGQQIFVMGVSEPNTCAFATMPLIQDLNGLGFPKDWTFAVACTQAAWEELQRKGDAFGTSTAFTNVRGRITILNGTIYLESLPLHGTTHPTPRMVLRHEYGHFVCRCGDEGKADRAAGLSNAARLSEFLGRQDGSYPMNRADVPRQTKPSRETHNKKRN